MRPLRWALCGAMLLTSGCVTHRGPWRLQAPPPEDGVELVLLANPAPSDRAARAVAARVEQHLETPRPRVLLWLGNVAATPRNSATPRAVRRGPRCASLEDAWAGDATAALARSARDHHPEHSFGTVGIHDHRCGHGPALRSGEPQGLHPFRIPAAHYVLRVFEDGEVQTRARCDEPSCHIEPPPPPTEATPLVDLVVVDPSPWLYPAEEPGLRAEHDRLVGALETMLAYVAQAPPDASPPRLLVSSPPVEAGGEHGLGALRPDATVHNLPATLQTMLVKGYFAGVLAAHDRSLYATTDLSDALKRADRLWLSQPVFQVAAGAVSRPNDRAAMAVRRRRVRRSQAYVPEVWSDHEGFAVVHLRPERARITLHARRGRRWQAASLEVPLRPAPHPSTTPSPVMAPCRDCPKIPAIER